MIGTRRPLCSKGHDPVKAVALFGDLYRCRLFYGHPFHLRSSRADQTHDFDSVDLSQYRPVFGVFASLEDW
jgi:hypothetical protein